ncbi:SGNH/GDSL hydrolase family protein [Nibrella saemangeumensis]|uniref:SGNH/GDSL hydrolase family protein n=1 Tax=Nibrella saemangeumensis TaxID=1084526 RepID=A0ABP8MNB6_9BACT
MKAFEKQDSLLMPPPGGIVFTGSSSVTMWRSLQQDFPGKVLVNRGFGGSQLVDANHYFDRIVAKYQPKQVFLYSGENDIAAKQTPEQVYERFKVFARNMKTQLPKAELVYISMKPSVSRWNQYPAMQKANRKIKRYAFWHPRVKFVDVGPVMLGTDGKPRPDIFLKDNLHMNRTGYELWIKVLEPHLAD